MPAMGGMHSAELEAGLALGGRFGLTPKGHHTKHSGGNPPNNGHIYIVKHGSQIHARKHSEHQHHDQNVAQTDTNGKEHPFLEAMVDAVLYQRKKCRANTEEQ